MKVYFYNNYYIRLSSKNYSNEKIDNKYIHLTNNSIQKKVRENEKEIYKGRMIIK